MRSRRSANKLLLSVLGILSAVALTITGCGDDGSDPMQPGCTPQVDAEFTASTTTGHVPLSVTFTDQSTGNPTSWSWNFGDGGSSTAQSPIYVYTTPGMYTVRLTVTDSCGSNVETKTNYINATTDKMTATLNPSKDNTLIEDTNGAFSNGSGQHLFAGMTANVGGNSQPAESRRAVLAFDISSITAGSTIDSVCLELRVNKQSTTSTKWLTLHRLQQDWGEGASDAFGEEGGGDLSLTGDATWIHTFFNTTMWSNSGGDFDAVPLDSVTVGASFTDVKFTGDALKALVQSWLDTPAGNFGVLIKGREDLDRTAVRFDSRESMTTDSRPRLTVMYTVP